MGRFYKSQFTGIAVTAQQDFFEILGTADKLLRIWRMRLMQETEIGDAQEEDLRITEQLGTGAVTSGSGGSTHTPVKVTQGDAAAAYSCEINNTTKMVVGSGAITQKGLHQWNVRAPYDYVYLPEERPEMAGAVRYCIRLDQTPTDSITMSGELLIEELG